MMQKSIALALMALIALPHLSMTNDDSGKLIYIGDPMCSWCYGFAPELETLLKELPEGESFEVITGGLRPYGKETMGELKNFLTHHWEDVHKRSGQEFNYGILDSSKVFYDTEPSCRAVITMRNMQPNKEFDYFKSVQKGFYYHNYHPGKTETFASQAEEMGIDRQKFIRLFVSDEMRNKTKADFQKSRQLGVNSFPSVLYEYEGKRHLIAQGYAKASVVLKRIEKIKKQ